MTDQIDVLLKVAGALRAGGVTCAAFGGAVLDMYGEPRAFQDADLVTVGADPATCARALAGIAELVETSRSGALAVTRFRLVDNAAPLVEVELFQAPSEEFGRAAVLRAPDGNLRGQPLRVFAPEDFVVYKVLSAREQDLNDAALVLRALELDRPQVAREIAGMAPSLPEHDVVERLRRAMALAGRAS
jgi:hypothetical protein